MNTETFDPKPILEGLPLLPGVYRFYDAEGAVLYVGKAKQLKRRVSSYFQKSDLSPRIRLMVSQVRRLETTVTRSEAEALLLENNLIKFLKPRYNILFRDDKSYPYIVLTGHGFPRLTYYRGTPAVRDQHFGPYPNVQAAKESMQLLQKIFRLRTCEDNVFNHRSRPCLLHQIQRCSAPCVGEVTAEAYAQDIHGGVLLLQGKFQEIEQDLKRSMEQASDALEFERAAVFRDQMAALHTVQQQQFVESTGGQTDADVIALAQEAGMACLNLVMIRGGRNLGDKRFFLEQAEDWAAEDILRAFLSQHYLEREVPPLLVLDTACVDEALSAQLNAQTGRSVKISTAQQGERKQWLEMAHRNAVMALGQRNLQHLHQRDRLARLQALLEMPDLQRIECFDISHTMGEATVASCVVYDQLDMRPSEYRRFNIKGITAGDDYAAMRQVLTRRYQKVAQGEGVRPSLVLIDGGAGQLHSAMEVMAELGLESLPLVGVAKGEARKPGQEQLVLPDGSRRQCNADDPALHLIQQIRDESHRFAITDHRARRGKARTTSSIEEIPGVGDARRRNLLAYFGGIRGVAEAGVDELAQVNGISRALAERIHRHFH